MSSQAIQSKCPKSNLHPCLLASKPLIQVKTSLERYVFVRVDFSLMTAEWMTLTFKPQQYLVLRYWPKSTGIYFTTAASQAVDYAIDHFSFFPSRQTVMSIFFRLKYNHHSTAMAFLGKSSQPLANLQFYSHHNTRCPACVMKQKQFRNQRTVWLCVTEKRCVCH